MDIWYMNMWVWFAVYIAFVQGPFYLAPFSNYTTDRLQTTGFKQIRDILAHIYIPFSHFQNVLWLLHRSFSAFVTNHG